jgi:hypothetical protein
MRFGTMSAAVAAVLIAFVIVVFGFGKLRDEERGSFCAPLGIEDGSCHQALIAGADGHVYRISEGVGNYDYDVLPIRVRKEFPSARLVRIGDPAYDALAIRYASQPPRGLDGK